MTGGVAQRREAGTRPRFRRGRGLHAPPWAHGEPLIWIAGGALLLALAMILGLVALVVVQGVGTFWPRPIVELTSLDGTAYLGEVVDEETYRPDASVLEELEPEFVPKVRAYLEANAGTARRRLLRTENFEFTGSHFEWVPEFLVQRERQPEWAVVVERYNESRLYGYPRRLLVRGKVTARQPVDIWRQVQQHLPAVHARRSEARRLERHELGRLSRELEAQRLAVRQAELTHAADSSFVRQQQARWLATQQAVQAATAEFRRQIDALDRRNAELVLELATTSGEPARVPLGEVVRAYAPNRLSWGQKVGLYLGRWYEFLTDDPRQVNSEGGVFPAIFGTLVMTVVMSAAVAPFGVAAALYLREYARAGWLLSCVRIAINNLAGVPSIVFGVFGLGFFCYFVGGQVDQWFFQARLPSPTFGTGGVLWASLTLALLTLPVVIVAAEEALAAVPNSMREGSYACGASKWQTLVRIVLPRAMPGIMTGMILAMSRGAGEVAPLMLVGAVKLAQDLPVDGVFPYLHLERSFMHLGFHIYDLGFQSQNSQAATPLVFTTTLLLMTLILCLNLTAIWVRARLRRRFQAGHF